MIDTEMAKAFFVDTFIVMSGIICFMAMLGVTLAIMFWIETTISHIAIVGRNKINNFFKREIL